MSQARPGFFVSLLMLVLFLAMTLGRLQLGSAITATSVTTWYQDLAKPSFTPPDWVFHPIWTFLYITMAIAAWRVWLQLDDRRRGRALLAFTIQLLINLGWSGLFFGLREILFALVDLTVLAAVVAYTYCEFRRIDKLAALFFIPYVIWIAFAFTLNLGILWLNQD